MFQVLTPKQANVTAVSASSPRAPQALLSICPAAFLSTSGT